jgi:hypothetical protein
MTDNVLRAQYRSACLRVELDDNLVARLFINNINRHEQSGETVPCVLNLSSTVQTDYEWHEYIEAIIKFGVREVTVKLLANNTEVAHETYSREALCG